jgi:hypothetical protein
MLCVWRDNQICLILFFLPFFLKFNVFLVILCGYLVLMTYDTSSAVNSGWLKPLFLIILIFFFSFILRHWLFKNWASWFIFLICLGYHGLIIRVVNFIAEPGLPRVNLVCCHLNFVLYKKDVIHNITSLVFKEGIV